MAGLFTMKTHVGRVQYSGASNQTLQTQVAELSEKIPSAQEGTTCKKQVTCTTWSGVHTAEVDCYPGFSPPDTMPLTATPQADTTHAWP